MIPDMPDAMTSIADRVRGIAAEKRYTQDRIAATLRLSRSSVNERMNGRVPWTAAELLVLAAVLRISPARFYPEATQVPEYAPAEAAAVPA